MIPVSQGKPCAGNPHARFEEGVSAQAEPRRSALLHNINIVSPETLRDAQKHPEKYENLQVRVAGWNIRWNDIPRKEQDEYIARIEAVGQ